MIIAMFKNEKFRLTEYIFLTSYYNLNIYISQNEECHTPLSSLFDFQPICIPTWKFLVFAIFLGGLTSGIRN